MITGYLYVAGASEVGIDHANKKYYVNADIINKDGYDYFMEVPVETFREILRTTFKWIEHSWNQELVEEYHKLLEV